VGVRGLGEGRFRAEGRTQGPWRWRAGPVAGWGCSACAALFFGHRVGAVSASRPRPQKTPHGADHPHPTPPARDAAWSLAPGLRPKPCLPTAAKPPDQNELPRAAVQRRQEAEQAPVALGSWAQFGAPAAIRRLQGAPVQPETNGLGHASRTKTPTLDCLPQRDPTAPFALGSSPALGSLSTRVSLRPIDHRLESRSCSVRA
jgi:hypothetical protein